MTLATVVVSVTIVPIETVQQPPQSGPVTIPLPAGDRFTNTGRHIVALSPDGTRLVYVANGRLYLQRLDGLETSAIPGADGSGAASPRSPFYSPDGRSIGFWQNGQLKKIPITGGAPVVLCPSQNPQGVSWMADGTILYGQGADGIWRVSDNGERPEQIVKVEAGRIAHGPYMLPDRHSVLFTLMLENDTDTGQVVVQSLKNGVRRVVVDGGTDARFIPSGHVVYATGRTLFIARFDVATLAVTGLPQPVAEGVALAPNGLAQFAVSNRGTLAYVPADAVESRVRSLVWVDRDGREEPIHAPSRWYVDPRLSPDGTRVALEIDNDIWIVELTRAALTRLTDDPAFESVPVWMPDGRAVIFTAGRTGRSTANALNLFRRAADGTGSTERLTDAAALRQVPYAVTPNGDVLVFREHSASPTSDRGDLMMLPLTGERASQPLLRTRFRELNAELSPDGHWLAYQSDESGQDEIYVRPFPDVSAAKWQVSSGGGLRPLWARSGQELFYEASGALVQVPVTIAASSFTAGSPRRLFAGPYFHGILERMYDVSLDGRRFLMIKEGRNGTPFPRLIVMPFSEARR
jgi:serine/threonine-protein kinase